MSASLQTIPWSTGRMLFKCSACHSHLPTENDRKEDLKFCWHCGEKFGPEPKQEPTPGEWQYDGVDGRIHNGVNGELIAEVYGSPRYANGHLMAASKKLLAVVKRIPITGEARRLLDIYHPKLFIDAQEAIAEAEKGKG